MADAMTGTDHKGRSVKKADVAPKVSAEVKNAFAQLRTEAKSQLKMNEGAFKQFVRNPAMEGGVRIVEKYDFGLRKITEQLSDADFASYMVLIQKEDPNLVKMLRELGEWQKGVPKPWKD
jgi:hypothetical protein